MFFFRALVGSSVGVAKLLCIHSAVFDSANPCCLFSILFVCVPWIVIYEQWENIPHIIVYDVCWRFAISGGTLCITINYRMLENGRGSRVHNYAE